MLSFITYKYVTEADLLLYVYIQDIDNGILVDGMILLTSLPTKKPYPMPFLSDSREVLDKVLLKVRQEFQRCHSHVVQEWSEWAKDCAPTNDSVEDYVQKNGMHIPLGNILFSDEPMDRSVVAEDRDGYVFYISFL